MIEQVFQQKLGIDTPVSLLLISGALVAARIIPAIAFSPFLGGESMPMEVKIGVGITLTLVLFPGVSERVAELPTGPLMLVLTLAKEVFIGICLAFVVSLVFDAVRVAGNLVDTMVGAQQAQLQVPMFQSQATLWSTFKVMLTVTLFLTMNGHHWVINILADSLLILPVDQFPRFGHGMWAFFETMIRVFADLLRLGLALSAPGMLAGFVTDLAMGMINRVAPQVQVFFVSMSIKPMVGALIIFITIYEIMSRVQREFQFMLETMQNAVRLLV